MIAGRSWATASNWPGISMIVVDGVGEFTQIGSSLGEISQDRRCTEINISE
jgi:hypothetical protein